MESTWTEILRRNAGGEMKVGERFEKFLSNLKLTGDQRQDGCVKHAGVRSCLNSYYYGMNSGSSNSMLIGSWGKGTEIRPPRDIDVLFVLPYSVYQRLEQVQGNKQSQLLQEVKTVLSKTYSTTKLRGDGQVVIVPFISYGIEVAPAFLLQSKQYWICDTNNGGSYKTIDPNAEIQAIQQSNDATVGNTRDLIRMMKCWQSECLVPLKSFVIELLAIEFLRTWENRGKSTVYYDWMVRDFFRFLIGKKNGWVWVPGTGEAIALGSDWCSKAESAYSRAEKATSFESQDMPFAAGEEWQKIFGTYIPAG